MATDREEQKGETFTEVCRRQLRDRPKELQFTVSRAGLETLVNDSERYAAILSTPAEQELGAGVVEAIKTEIVNMLCGDWSAKTQAVKRARINEAAEKIARHLPPPTPEGAVHPIPMILHCPRCGLQHTDEPEAAIGQEPSTGDGGLIPWTNPPHRSHLCRPEHGGCGAIWRPADVPTVGVQAVKTIGKADTPLGKLTPEGAVRTGGVKEAASDLLEAAKALEDADQFHANCTECGGEEVPELCRLCFPLFDNARLLRRAAIARAEGRS